MEKSVIDLALIYNRMLEPIFKLKGIAELFFTTVNDDQLTLSEKARNGIYFTLSDISDELQGIKDDCEALEGNEG